ncbi:MAG: hypothetical protein H7838_05865 [Magnetococcus sp. DMHC-8]
MNLLGQQQPSAIQQGGAGLLAVLPGDRLHTADDSFALGELTDSSQLVPVVPTDNTLALLEARLSGLLRMIAGLNARNDELRKMVADRDEYIELVEQENELLTRQVERFTMAQDQVIDGLADILNRFPGGMLLEQADEEYDYLDAGLLEETVGNA